MTQLSGTVVSVHAGEHNVPGKDEQASITVEFDGVVGDRHRSLTRKCWSGDKQARGTVRRNERQWTAVSVEELEEIGAAMNLAEPLTAGQLGANLCIAGIAQFSRLPKGTLLKFPSGAELVVVEYNPPCRHMGERLMATHTTRSGEPLSSTSFSKAAKLKRGVLGIVDVPGTITAGDAVEVAIYEHPTWLARTAD